MLADPMSLTDFISLKDILKFLRKKRPIFSTNSQSVHGFFIAGSNLHFCAGNLSLVFVIHQHRLNTLITFRIFGHVHIHSYFGLLQRAVCCVHSDVSESCVASIVCTLTHSSI
jgi:hypothetical protein